MSNIDFSTLNTLEGFKDFLQAYHAQLSSQRSFPPLGIQKALHTAAPVFGHNDWHIMSAAMHVLSANLHPAEYAEPQEDDRVHVVSITINSLDSDGNIESTDTEIVRNWDKAKENISERLYDKASRNDRSLEEILDCRGINLPDEDDLEGLCDLEPRAVLDWIVENNDIDELIELLSYLDFNQTQITTSDHWV